MGLSDDIVREVRASGVRFVVESSYNQPWRAASGSWSPIGVLMHHTASAGNSLHYIIDGNPYAPTPAAHALVDRDGLVHLIAWYRVNHAGAGVPQRIPAGYLSSGNGQLLGVEIEDPGLAQTIPPVAIDAAARLAAAWLRAVGQPDAGNAINHRTWAGPRKVDTRYPDSFWQSRIAEHLEGDVALSDEDVQRIADAVWTRAVEVEGKKRKMGAMLISLFKGTAPPATDEPQA